jgi:hypothetical protein
MSFAYWEDAFRVRIKVTVDLSWISELRPRLKFFQVSIAKRTPLPLSCPCKIDMPMILFAVNELPLFYAAALERVSKGMYCISG